MADPKDEVRSLLLEHADPPEYVYDPENWEVTYAWDDRSDLIDDVGMRWGPIGEPKLLKTLVHGPDKWVANIVLSWDDTGDPDETELRWFDSLEEAKRAITESLATKV